MQQLFVLVMITSLFCENCKGVVDVRDIIDSVAFIIEKYFEGECLSVVNMEQEVTELQLLLYKRLHKVNDFYLITPINETLNKVPYPCFYLIILGEIQRLLPIDTRLGARFFLHKQTVPSKYVAIAQKELDELQIYESLLSVFNRGHPEAILLNIEETITVYTLFPFGDDLKKCPENGILLKKLDSWINGSFGNVEFFPNKVPQIFNGCFLNVSATEYLPYTIINGDNVEGIDGDMIELVAESLNMTATWFIRDNLYNKTEDGKYIGVLPDVLFGRSQIACGGLVSLPFLTEYVHFTLTYFTSHLTWYLPYPPYEPTWKTMYKAFEPRLLVFSLVILFIAPIFVTITAKNTIGEITFFKGVTRCYVATWALAVGNTTGTRPKTTPVRIIYVFWLIYTIHLSLAYTASLTGLLTKNAHRPKVRNFNDLIATGLPTAMQDLHQITTMTISDPEVRRALDKVVMINSTDVAINIIAQYGNMSLLDNSAYVNYKICSKSRKPRLYNSGLSTFPMKTGLMMRKSHYFYECVNKVIVKLVESGINDRVSEMTTKCRKNRGRWRSAKFKASTLTGLSGTFIILFLGLLLATVVFCGELFVYKRNLKKNKNKILPRKYFPFVK